jgi:cellulose synthase/poly-beta-1,6-N-acetylglucosamine synthase-like glycosyltransferase/peptidoglycan/xylan/chitin deacetylase (PgdA/CDA1 family)/spore germination protein YaaH
LRGRDKDLSSHRLPVFFDPSGRRGYVVSAMYWAICTLLGVVMACLLATSIDGPSLPLLHLSGPQRLVSTKIGPAPASANEPVIDPEHARTPADSAAMAATRYGYFVNWDDNSFSSLKRNASSLDVAIVEWLHAVGSSGSVTRSDPGKEAMVRRWVRSNAQTLKLYPLVNNYNAEAKEWEREATAQMLSSKQARANFADELYHYVIKGGFSGLVLDFENLPAEAHAGYVSLVREIADMLRVYQVKLLVAVPASDPAFDYGNLAAAADALIIMTYDQHGEQDEPGPLAGQGWFEAKLDERFKEIDAKKLIISIGSYGYDWSEPGSAREISVQEAWELLDESKGELSFDKASLNPTFSYSDDGENKRHQVWFLDGVTGYNQIAAALAMRPAGLALWRLGTEDPSIWAAFARHRKPDAEAAQATQQLQSGYDLLYKGTGEVLSITGEQQPGTREIEFDAEHNLITNQEISVFPQSATVTRWGARADKVIALTFDDGPDRTYTPQVLDVLAQKDVKASFFIVGSAGAINGDLLQRIHREGHDIGNHTFTHINSAEVSSEHLKLELNATQRLLEATVGVRTKLFRPPFARDLEPQTIDAAEALRLAGSLGYLSIGMNIDPKDWARSRADVIVSSTLEGARKGEGNVILLHDAGGSRAATVAALPVIIDTLKAEGFRFVSIHELLGLSREEVMPAVSSEDRWIVSSNYAGFRLYSVMYAFVSMLFVLGLALGTLRLAWICSFALVHAWRERERAGRDWRPPSIAVLIPAYNEEKVICNSIRALLASRTKKFKIIVVDDGSSDKTAEVVRETFAHTSRVSVLTKRNEGKWAALNYGIAQSDAEIIVTLDADTLFDPAALSLLARHFEDPSVGAVAGSAVVGNRINLITRFQALEYITNQNLDRRALEIVNGIPVIPGAIGAWRRDALLAIGGFHSDTLAEDADATVRMERAGWKVLCEPGAIAHTEAPETIRSFMKQRLRWMFGTLQVAYKNRSAMWRVDPIGVGLFCLPNIIVFQFLFTLLAPLIDLVLLWTIVAAFMDLVMHPNDGLPQAVVTVATYWAYFQLLELATATVAMAIDRKPNAWRLLPLLLIQRFCYRQLLCVIAMQVAIAALKGKMLGWNKLIRTGSVVLGSASNAARSIATG